MPHTRPNNSMHKAVRKKGLRIWPVGKKPLPLQPYKAQMAESVDALVSNTSGATRAGSTPALGTGKRQGCLFQKGSLPLYFPPIAKNVLIKASANSMKDSVPRLPLGITISTH